MSLQLYSEPSAIQTVRSSSVKMYYRLWQQMKANIVLGQKHPVEGTFPLSEVTSSNISVILVALFSPPCPCVTLPPSVDTTPPLLHLTMGFSALP